MVNNTNPFAKTICPICYEDLKPIIEDLQSISICGHVFHELCLQQWFEYCPSAKKRSCPVCKQSCSSSDVSRLYLQSVGDQNDQRLSQTAVNCEEDPFLLREEVTRLDAKVSGLGSILDRQGKEIKQLNDELLDCNYKLKKEVILRNDAEEQKTSIQRLLFSKTNELDKVKLEYLRLQERNLSLAKELAAIKLVWDLNLDEDEALRLATFGGQNNNKDTIDILRKSLIIRNRSYKELMAKCNQLGGGEARSCKRLEKAEEKIYKLKSRIRELETVVEMKDNEVLRALRASKKNHYEGVILSGIDDCSVSTNNLLSKDQKEQSFVSMNYFDQIGSLKSNQENFSFIDVGANSYKECKSTIAPNKEKNAFAIDEAASKRSIAVHVHSDPDTRQLSTTRDVASSLINLETVSDINRETKACGLSEPDETLDTRTCISNCKGKARTPAKDEEVKLFADHIREVQPILNIKKVSPSPVPLSKPGEICFSSGLVGPDGTTRYLGKWCKRGQGKGSGTQGTGTSSGELIAVGSDGRGGRIKVLRSLNSSSMESKENSTSAKRCKYGANASTSQSQGCLQIEHFFGRASH